MLRNLDLRHLCLTMCKGIDFQSCRHIKYTRNLRCCFKLRIDDHGKSQTLFQIFYLLAVVRISDTRYRCAVTSLFCDRTTKQVQLVRICYCDHKIGILHTGFHQHTVACTISADSHNVILIDVHLNLIRIFINDCYIMPFLA